MCRKSGLISPLYLLLNGQDWPDVDESFAPSKHGGVPAILSLKENGYHVRVY